MERVSLPIKTKIAAWWMIVIGVIGIGRQVYHFIWRITNPEWLVYI